MRVTHITDLQAGGAADEYDGVGILGEREREQYCIGHGTSVIDAIRSAGIRCETCEHLQTVSGTNTVDLYCENIPLGSPDPYAAALVEPGFFCADHSKLNQD